MHRATETTGSTRPGFLRLSRSGNLPQELEHTMDSRACMLGRNTKLCSVHRCKGQCTSGYVCQYGNPIATGTRTISTHMGHLATRNQNAHATEIVDAKAAITKNHRWRALDYMVTIERNPPSNLAPMVMGTCAMARLSTTVGTKSDTLRPLHRSTWRQHTIKAAILWLLENTLLRRMGQLVGPNSSTGHSMADIGG